MLPAFAGCAVVGALAQLLCRCVVLLLPGVAAQVHRELAVLLERLFVEHLREEVSGVRLGQDVADRQEAVPSELAYFEELVVDVR